MSILSVDSIQPVSTGTTVTVSNGDLNIGTDVNIGRSGIVTASSFSGNITGNATGLSGSPNITVGNITASVTLTYEDVTNVDAIGIITARNGIQVSSGSSI